MATDKHPVIRQIISYICVLSLQQGRTDWASKPSATPPARFVAADGYELIGEFVEVETGKGCDALERRSQLPAALAQARKAQALAKPRDVKRAGHESPQFEGQN